MPETRMTEERAMNKEIRTSITLADDDLTRLDGMFGPGIQAKVDAAKARIAARSTYPGLINRESAFIADVVREATEQGRLMFRRERLRDCNVCTKSAGYAKYKSGPRRGQTNYDRPLTFDGYELAHRFVRISGRATVGCCTDCWVTVEEHVREALMAVKAELPHNLLGSGDQRRYKWYRNMRCTKCGWAGHEGQMGRRRTLMGDGTYPTDCPQCDAANTFGVAQIKTVDGFTLTEAKREGGL